MEPRTGTLCFWLGPQSRYPPTFDPSRRRRPAGSDVCSSKKTLLHVQFPSLAGLDSRSYRYSKPGGVGGGASAPVGCSIQRVRLGREPPLSRPFRGWRKPTIGRAGGSCLNADRPQYTSQIKCKGTDRLRETILSGIWSKGRSPPSAGPGRGATTGKVVNVATGRYADGSHIRRKTLFLGL